MLNRKRIVLLIIVLISLILSWNTIWVWQLSKIAASEKGPLYVRAPTYYETNNIQVGAFALVYGKKPHQIVQLQKFFDDPVLVLIDGSISRYWDISQMSIESKFRDLKVTSGSILPTSQAVGLTVHLTGPGKLLPERPGSLRVFFDDLIGGVLFGEKSKTANNRFFLAMDGKTFKKGTTSSSDFLLNLEARVRPASFFIRSALGRKQLEPKELRSEPNFEKINCLGFPAFISARMPKESSTKIKMIIEKLDKEITFKKLLKSHIKVKLSYVFLEAQEFWPVYSRGEYYQWGGKDLITCFVWEDDSILLILSMLVHETFHALQFADVDPRKCNTNEGKSFSESSAMWIQAFVAAQKKGLRLFEDSEPSKISVWPPAGKYDFYDTSLYNLDTFIHWIFLLSEKSFEDYVLELIKQLHSARFKGLVQNAGYNDFGMALIDYFAYCWWGSLGFPDTISPPFKENFIAISKKDFYSEENEQKFRRFATDLEKLEKGENLYPTPGAGIFLNGSAEYIGKDFKLLGTIPDKDLLIHVAFLKDGKYLSHRKLESIEETADLMAISPTGANSCSIWIHRKWGEPTNDKGSYDPSVQGKFYLTTFSEKPLKN